MRFYENDCPWSFIEAVIAVILLIPLILILIIPIAYLIDRSMGEVFFSPSGISNFGFTLGYFVQTAAFLILLWFFVFYRNRASWYDLGIRSFNFLKGVFLIIFGIIVTFIIHIAYNVIFRSIIPWDTGQTKIIQLIENKNISIIMLFIVAVIIAPFCEELFFRGFLYPAFKKKMKVLPAMFLSSILFAVFHFEPAVLILLLGMGFVLVFMYEKTGSLIPSILLHLLYNLAAIIILFHIKY